MTVHFREITPENWRSLNSLKVKEEQTKYVASNVTIMARAYAFCHNKSPVYAIYHGELPIGLLMLVRQKAKRPRQIKGSVRQNPKRRAK
ncbi:hypothetical protein [Sporosarcina sp. Te-1]|uniref:hypothetical protein n=1 Tax=Sporosarcina sp. Te-1 TaxID=2818390 RepID=UPI001A9CE304|nr:hypothetical protein [Sporosarcina sp. Te-1]QTD42604.1 hypothetical protein J3U78_07320 [Sporosarcina sp. Te-1]